MYGVTFTSLVFKAVHLELANLLKFCINAKLQFNSRKSQVVAIMSHNGNNFFGAERDLREYVCPGSRPARPSRPS